MALQSGISTPFAVIGESNPVYDSAHLRAIKQPVIKDRVIAIDRNDNKVKSYFINGKMFHIDSLR